MKKRNLEFSLYVRRGRFFCLPTLEVYDYNCGNCDVRHKGAAIYFLIFVFDFAIIEIFSNVQR